MFYVLVFVVFGVVGAYALRARLSGEDLNTLKLFSCVIFNGFFVVSYIEVIKYGEFPFLGLGLILLFNIQSSSGLPFSAYWLMDLHFP